MQRTTGNSLLRKVLLLSWCCFVPFGALAASGLHLNEAENLYQRTDYQGSLSLLDRQTDDPSTDFLIARDYFMLADYKKATDSLQRAIAAAPAKSEYMDWLGKIYGKRAENSNPLLAPGLAVKARQSFERSIELDPRNSEALEDLFDYYLEAPGFLGGGYDKASDVAGKIAAVDPSEGHYVKAKLAQKRKEYREAELHLRQAVAADAHAVGHQIALAKFLANQGRTRESDEVLQAAQKEQPNSPKLWFARADILVRQNRDLTEAKLLLERYLEAPVTVDDPPKEQAVKLLKQAGA